VEIRNKEYLGLDYFEVLSRHKVAHVFNAWTRLPVIGEQIELPGAHTADFTVVRALLQHGRSYEQAVKMFEPYQAVREPDRATRDALRQVAERAMRVRQPAYVFVNNRLEGNAPGTIEAVIASVNA
jgi:hypothetical protein